MKNSKRSFIITATGRRRYFSDKPKIQQIPLPGRFAWIHGLDADILAVLADLLEDAAPNYDPECDRDRVIANELYLRVQEAKRK